MPPPTWRRGLQGNLKNAKGKFVTKRAEAIKDLDDFEGTRDAAAAIRNKVIDNLDLWLERFEQKARIPAPRCSGPRTAPRSAAW
jgi:L-lactate dehydrogenase complex protein LldF